MVVAVTKQAEKELDVRMIPIADIEADSNIRTIKDGDLKELVDSIKEQGVKQPILVRPLEPKGFELCAGYRRRRAAILAGLSEIPARVEKMTDAQFREVQLVENLHRQDLDPMDEARAYKAYIEATKTTQADLAKKIGKSQPYIANRIRLTSLHKEIHAALKKEVITVSHAEVLARLPADNEDDVQDLVNLIEDIEYNGIPVKDLARDVDYQVKERQRWDETRAKEAAAFSKLVEGSRFKSCPSRNCGKPPVIEDSSPKYFGCGKHHWSPKTGTQMSVAVMQQLDDRVSEDDHDYERPRPKPKPKAPIEPSTFRSFHATGTIGKQLVKDLNDAAVTRVNVHKHYGGEVEIRLFAKGSGYDKLEFIAEPHDYGSGERSRVQVSTWNDGRRKEVRKAFEGWAKKALPKPKVKKGNGKKADPEILEGSIDEIVKRLPKDEELLEDLRRLEIKGKKRKSLVDFIDQRLSIRLYNN